MPHLSRRAFTKGMVSTVLASAYASPFKAAIASSREANSSVQFINQLPKAELHVHIEGTVEPAKALKIAERNGSRTPYQSVEQFEAALNFTSLESFLEGFHNTIAVLQTEEDFYEITRDYLTKCHNQNILHVDIMFDPQAHQRRGLAFETFYRGIEKGLIDARNQLGISSQLIMCFQRDASLETAEAAFQEAEKYREYIVGVGLDNTEILNFPTKFSDLFSRARDAGFKLTSHCDLGQPNTVEHIRACIEDLGVDRLDHGYNILQDDRLIDIALEKNLCFTACPTSAFNTTDHSKRYYFSEVCRSIGEMLDHGLRVTINTDDPGVMGNRHLNEVMTDAVDFLGLNKNQVITLARNSLEALWLPEKEKANMLLALKEYEEIAA